MQEITFEDGHKTREFFLARDPQALIEKHGDALEKVGVKEIRQTIVRDADPCPCGSGMKFGRCRCRKRLNQGPFVVGGPSDPSPAKELVAAAAAIAIDESHREFAAPSVGSAIGSPFAPAGDANGPGILEVGIQPERREVVINLPRDMTGHICFTAEQAEGLAKALLRKASELGLASPAAVLDRLAAERAAMGKGLIEADRLVNGGLATVLRDLLAAIRGNTRRDGGYSVELVDVMAAADRALGSLPAPAPDNGLPPKLASSDDVPAAVVDAMGKTIAEMSDAELTDYFQHLAPSLEYALPPGANADGRVNYVLVLLEPPDVVAHISNCDHLEKVRILREVADRIEAAAKGDAGPKAN